MVTKVIEDRQVRYVRVYHQCPDGAMNFAKNSITSSTFTWFGNSGANYCLLCGARLPKTLEELPETDWNEVRLWEAVEQ